MSKVLSGRVLNGRNQAVWEMHINNHSQAEIAKHLGISQQRVSQILHEWVTGMELPPRQERQRLRVAQYDNIISDLDERRHAAAERKNMQLFIQLTGEMRKWCHERSLILGEHAPKEFEIEAHDPAPYILEGDPEIQKALR